jgi:anti-sigma factor RsiW
MKCPIETRDHTDRLLDYASGRLDAGAAAGLERHLETCAACREFVEGQQSVWQALDIWEAEPVSPDFDRRLLSRLEPEQSWWSRLWSPLHPARFRLGLGMGAAAALLIVAGALVQQRPGLPPLPTSPSAQAGTLEPEQVEDALDEMEMLDEFYSLVPADGPESKM